MCQARAAGRVAQGAEVCYNEGMMSREECGNGVDGGLPSGWREETGIFTSSCGKYSIFERFWRREKMQTGRVLAVFHGFGEHGGRYGHFVSFLDEVIDGLYVIDLRGHGRSEGKRGHVADFDEYVRDQRLALRRLEERVAGEGGKPGIHLLGHSMGGLIALKLLMTYGDLPFCSVTISAPLLGIALTVPLFKRLGALVLSTLWGSLGMRAGIDISKLSHDRRVEEALRADRLSHGKMTPALFSEILRGIREVKGHKGTVPYNILFLIPGEDYIVDSASTERFFEKLSCACKKRIAYEHAYHEIFNEGGGDEAEGIPRRGDGFFDKERAFADLGAWIRAFPSE